MLLGPPADAEARGSARGTGGLLVLESHAVEPHASERPLVAQLVATFGHRAPPREIVARRIEATFGTPAPVVSERRRELILGGLKDAAQATYLGEWERATRLLRWVRQELSDDMIGQVRRRAIFDALQQARLLLAECHARSGRKAEAWRAMEEALRAQPDLGLPPALYGPILQKLCFRVRNQLALQRGTLRVETTPPGALVFLAGRHVGVSPVVVTGLTPGSYPLVAVHGERFSRVHRVELRSEPGRATIDFARDAELQTGRTVGFVIPAGRDREARELRWGREVARRLGARQLILVGVQQRMGRRALVGRILDVARRRTDALAFVFLEPELPSRGTLRRLGSFLLHGGSPGRGVTVVGPRVRRAPRRASAASLGLGGSPGLWAAGWTLLAVGLAAGASGGALVAIHGTTQQEASETRSRRVYDTKVLGNILLGVGAGITVSGAVLLLVEGAMRGASRGPDAGRREAAVRIAPLGDGIGLRLAGTW